jgi:hypothetical protein
MEGTAALHSDRAAALNRVDKQCQADGDSAREACAPRPGINQPDGDSAGEACASRPGENCPLPPHHGHVTVCGSPPRAEMTAPRPSHGVQMLRVESAAPVLIARLTIAAPRADR